MKENFIVSGSNIISVSLVENSPSLIRHIIRNGYINQRKQSIVSSCYNSTPSTSCRVKGEGAIRYRYIIAAPIVRKRSSITGTHVADKRASDHKGRAKGENRSPGTVCTIHLVRISQKVERSRKRNWGGAEVGKVH